mmetsp:Transcript_6663/g.20186  ORF Transcript_6663/g.20186 Transcript_6663/m.20186 type:complete len:108 (-) Transcript_6663:404-727(-)
MSETKVADLWDEAIETGLKRIGYGLLAGCGSAIVLARSNVVRTAIIGLSVGVGVGMTYAETQSRFRDLSASAKQDTIADQTLGSPAMVDGSPLLNSATDPVANGTKA